MQVQMNIEVAAGRERELARELRVKFRVWALVQPLVVSYEGPSGPETQTVQVVAVETEKSRDNVVGIAYALSLEFDQDCVAVYFPENDQGLLVGPNAAKWGDFDPTFFHQPLPVADPLPQDFVDSVTSIL
jgi:hypothetical protein